MSEGLDSGDCLCAVMTPFKVLNITHIVASYCAGEKSSYQAVTKRPFMIAATVNK